MPKIVPFSLLLFVTACPSSTTLPDSGADGRGDATIDTGRDTRDGGLCADECGTGRACCDGQCTNPFNDPRNCGDCGVTCGDGEYCTGAVCVAIPCDKGASCGLESVCCGTECCGAGELCCDPQGPVEVGARCVEASETGSCPPGCAPLCQCTSPDTPIATPTGDRPIASLRTGDLVFSVDGSAIRAVPIVRTNRVPVTHHVVVRVELSNGSVLEISPRHPTAEGRPFADLEAGEELGGTNVVSVTLVPFVHTATYDILPASDTGTYIAGGAVIGSTLFAGN